MKVFTCQAMISSRVRTMKQKLWHPLVTCLAYCIGKELYKAIDYLREQVRVLVEHQENQANRIRRTSGQRTRVTVITRRQ